MKKLTILVIAALCIFASCAKPEAAPPRAITDIVPYFAHAQVSIPLRSNTGYYGNVPATDAQASEILDLLKAIPLDQFEECEPNSVLGSALQFNLENAEDPGESCKLTLVTADQGGISAAPTPKEPAPAGTVCVTFSFDDGTQQSFQGVYADFPYQAFADCTDAICNDTEDTANTGTVYMLAAPENTKTISKGAAVRIGGIFEETLARAEAVENVDGSYDAALVLQGVTYRLDTASGLFAREKGGQAAVGRLADMDHMLVLTQSGLPLAP